MTRRSPTFTTHTSEHRTTDDVDTRGRACQGLTGSESLSETFDLLRGLAARMDMDPAEYEFENVLTGDIVRMKS